MTKSDQVKILNNKIKANNAQYDKNAKYLLILVVI